MLRNEVHMYPDVLDGLKGLALADIGARGRIAHVHDGCVWLYELSGDPCPRQMVRLWGMDGREMIDPSSPQKAPPLWVTYRSKKDGDAMFVHLYRIPVGASGEVGRASGSMLLGIARRSVSGDTIATAGVLVSERPDLQGSPWLVRASRLDHLAGLVPDRYALRVAALCLLHEVASQPAVPDHGTSATDQGHMRSCALPPALLRELQQLAA